MSKTILVDGFRICTSMALAGSCPVDEPERVQRVIAEAVRLFGAEEIYFETGPKLSYRDIEEADL